MVKTLVERAKPIIRNKHRSYVTRSAKKSDTEDFDGYCPFLLYEFCDRCGDYFVQILAVSATVTAHLGLEGCPQYPIHPFAYMYGLNI